MVPSKGSDRIPEPVALDKGLLNDSYTLNHRLPYEERDIDTAILDYSVNGLEMLLSTPGSALRCRRVLDATGSASLRQRGRCRAIGTHLLTRQCELGGTLRMAQTDERLRKILDWLTTRLARQVAGLHFRAPSLVGKDM